jgi:hypothetical protein
MKTLRFTSEMLEAKGACLSEVERFRQNWPHGAPASLASFRKAARLGFDLNWLASHFLSAPAQEAYEKAMALAQEAYEKAMALAQEAYEKALALAIWVVARSELERKTRAKGKRKGGKR